VWKVVKDVMGKKRLRERVLSPRKVSGVKIEGGAEEEVVERRSDV
jgi:hypothetical protein